MDLNRYIKSGDLVINNYCPKFQNEVSKYSYKDDKREKLAYIAGLFDGEGSFIIAKSSPGKGYSSRPYRYQARAALAIREECLVKLLKENFGGSYRFVKTVNPKHSNIYRWDCQGKALDKFIRDIYPFLIIKQNQCKLLRVFQKVKRQVGNRPISDLNYNRSENLYNRLRELNRKGPKI